ncbi:MAG: putative thiol peroxidase [Chlamydiae bacterium]|nr:putative thiol peroxidase [Chlamydiota bacterium]
MAEITFKGDPISTNGELPAVGEMAPDFFLTDGNLHDHSLKDYLGKKTLLSIAPSLDTSVCSLMAKKFNRELHEHPEVLAIFISADLPFAQKRFCKDENIENLLFLSMMRSKDFARDYGVLIVDGPLAGLCARGVVVLDEMNLVTYSELVPEIVEEPNYDAALYELLRS